MGLALNRLKVLLRLRRVVEWQSLFVDADREADHRMGRDGGPYGWFFMSGGPPYPPRRLDPRLRKINRTTTIRGDVTFFEVTSIDADQFGIVTRNWATMGIANPLAEEGR